MTLKGVGNDILHAFYYDWHYHLESLFFPINPMTITDQTPEYLHIYQVD